nr:uncharacterized protein LOC112801285 [Arachis hypogaea]
MKFVEINIRKENNKIIVYPLPSLISSNHMNPNKGCRPFIGLDDTFLKGLLWRTTTHYNKSRCEQPDFSNCLCRGGFRDNWKWFMEHLHNDLGNYKVHGWNFISDQQKGLIPVMQQVMLGVHHRFCAMHIWNNFTQR